MFQSQGWSECSWPQQSSMMEMCVNVWIGVCISTTINSHIVLMMSLIWLTIIKAASPLKWNTCSAVRQVLFITPVKIKVFYSIIVFRHWNDSDGKGFYWDFYRGHFYWESGSYRYMKGMILTLSPDWMWQKAFALW